MDCEKIEEIIGHAKEVKEIRIAFNKLKILKLSFLSRFTELPKNCANKILLFIQRVISTFKTLKNIPTNILQIRNIFLSSIL